MELVDIHYPKAERIRVLLDNLSTHTGGHSGKEKRSALAQWRRTVSPNFQGLKINMSIYQRLAGHSEF